MISIVIPVKNGGGGLRTMLEAIQSQEVNDEVEVVVVDSGSTDGSQELARSFGAAVHEIPPEQFNHGGTRNLGAKLARGETIVFTVDDAEPVGTDWLETLVAPLREKNGIAGTYSRHMAHEHAPAYLRHYTEYRWGPTPRVQRARTADEMGVRTAQFANVSSAIRRPLLEQFPFADDLVTGEDAEWAGRVLLAGYEIAYVPGSVVRHSHDYTLADWFRRYFDQGAASHRTVIRGRGSSVGAVRREGARYVAAELRWMWRNGERRAIPHTLVCEATRYLALRIGAHHGRLPVSLKRRWSQWPTYWS